MISSKLVMGLVVTALIGSSAVAQTARTQHVFDLSQSDAGRQLEVSAGDLINVSLSNSASTGYRWFTVEVDPTYLVLVDKTVKAPPTQTPPVVGAPEQIIYTYYVKKSLNLGSYTVSTPLIFIHMPAGSDAAKNSTVLQFKITSR